MMSSKYYQQVELLLEVLPLLNKFPNLALKGGTAINLFEQNMPRLSVDIDLCYLAIEPREIFLKNISRDLTELSIDIEEKCQAIITKIFTKDKQLSKLLLTKNFVEVKIEPNLVLRGSVYGSDKKILCSAAQDKFLKSFRCDVLSTADVYAGKICAALDRQHPRDLFDIKILFENGGITDQIRKAFIVYLACSPRPMHELLDPNLIDISQLYENEFSGMTSVTTSYEELIDIRQKLIELLKKTLKQEERNFLYSVKQGQPQWYLLGIPGIEKLPGIQWKVMNIKKLEEKKHLQLMNKLKEVLEI